MQHSREAPQNAQMRKNAVFLQITSKVTIRSPLANGKQYCSRTATGVESPHSEGEITYTELFCPTTTAPVPVFSHKMSPM